MYEIPTFVLIDNIKYGIRNDGDYRMVLDCFKALQDVNLTERERVFASLIIFYQDLNTIDDVLLLNNITDRISGMYTFFNCGEEDTVGAKVPYRLIDWEQDSQLICSAVNKVATAEIRSLPYLHWWTFMGYFTSIGKSLLSSVIAIREKIIKGKKLEKYERDFRRDNPKYFVWNHKSIEELEAEKAIMDLWNNGG